MLFQSFKMKGLNLRNRVVAAPMATCSCTTDGVPTEKTFAFYRSIADTAPGLAILGHHAVHPWGRNYSKQLRLDSNDAARSLTPLVDIFATRGVPVLAQLNFSGGKVADPALLAEKDFRSVSASPILLPKAGINSTPDALSSAEIQMIVTHFALAAERAVKVSGYSGIQLQACHGYLIGQFLSRLTNKRCDAWGGNRKKRAKFLFSIMEAIQGKLPPHAILTIRLGVADHMPDEAVFGLTTEDTLPIVRELVHFGVDCIHISGNHCGFGGCKIRRGPYFSPYAKAVKDSVGDRVPVECTGGVRTAKMATMLIERGVCDFVGLARPLYQQQDFLSGWCLA